MTTRITLIVTIAAMLSTQTHAGVIADSAAEFSGTQGENNWYYGYWDRTNDANGTYQPAEFQAMTQYLTTPSGDFGPSLHSPCWRVLDGAYWTALWNTGGHPNGTNGNAGHLPVEQWTIRRYVSEVSGPIDITGQFGCSDGFACDVNARILIDGLQTTFMTTSNGPLQNFAVSTPVNIGSTVDFVIDPNGFDFNDMTYFTATITPEPATAALLIVGTSLLTRRIPARRRLYLKRVSVTIA